MTLLRIASATLLAGLFSASALADAPPCNEEPLLPVVKINAAKLSAEAEAAPGDEAVLAALAEGITLSDIVEDSYDAATNTRVCYANITATTTKAFEGAGIVYTLVGTAGTAEGVSVKVDGVPKR